MKSGILVAKLLSKAALLEGCVGFKRLAQQTGISIKRFLNENWIRIDNFQRIKLKGYKEYTKSLILIAGFNNYNRIHDFLRLASYIPKLNFLFTGTKPGSETGSTSRDVCTFLSNPLKVSFLKIPFSDLGSVVHHFLFCNVALKELICSLLIGFKLADISIENWKETKMHKRMLPVFFIYILVESDLMLF